MDAKKGRDPSTMIGLATPVAVFDEFLAPMELARALALIARRASRFQPSQVSKGTEGGAEDPEFRRSHVLYDAGPYHGLVATRLAWFLPQVFHRLAIPPFQVADMELQLTSSGDRGFFRAHSDSDAGASRGRAVTFVLYCHREPRAFSGGELLVYGRDPVTGADARDVATVVRPAQNRMVLFSSDRLHEVAPVYCRSDALLDTRLTLNGWLHR
jgi:Rps23 Pro-64 3,4-dihydroxylase Tpa1-like proline 4-hydroxylase